MAAKVAKALEGDLAGKTIGGLGLTFKPNTDDDARRPGPRHHPGPAEAGAPGSRPTTPRGRRPSTLLKDVDF